MSKNPTKTQKYASTHEPKRRIFLNYNHQHTSTRPISPARAAYLCSTKQLKQNIYFDFFSFKGNVEKYSKITPQKFRAQKTSCGRVGISFSKQFKDKFTQFYYRNKCVFDFLLKELLSILEKWLENFEKYDTIMDSFCSLFFFFFGIKDNTLS